MLEKTGLVSDLKYRGDVYLSVTDKEDELISHMLFHVFSGEKTNGNLNSDGQYGKCFWGKIKDIPEKDQMPGFKEIVKLLSKQKTHFFEEFFIKMLQ